jgi:hypothetical protein
MSTGDKSAWKTPAVAAALVTATAGIVVAIIEVVIPAIWHSPAVSQNPPPILIVQGRITDNRSHGPLANAKVTLAALGNPPPQYSDSNGIFSISLGPSQSTLSGRITVDAERYEEYTQDLQVGPNPQSLDIRLSAIQGGGTPIPRLPKIPAKPIDYSLLRTMMRQGNVTTGNIEVLLRDFRFDSSPVANPDEARRMLIDLGSQAIYQRDRNSCSGRVGSKEITIWWNSFGNPRQYGIRYGNPDGRYWSSNDTLISINKPNG